MSLTGEFHIGLDAFPLATAITESPSVRIDVVPVTLAPTALSPFFWAAAADVAAFEDALTADDSVTTHTNLDAVDDAVLYRARYAEPPTTLVDVLDSTGTSIITATGTRDGWRCRIRFPSREAFQRFRDRLRAAGVHVETLSLVTADGSPRDALLGLSEKQAEALSAAWTCGYYDQPRRATLDEIASTLDISKQALSDRLRRATRTLVQRAVVDGVYFDADRDR